MIATQYDLKALFDDQTEAIRNRDVDRLMSLYAPDILYFDVVPPLRYAGTTALRRRFQQWFDAYKGSLKVESATSRFRRAAISRSPTG